MTEILDHVQTALADAVIDDRDAGVSPASRRTFTDEAWSA